MRRGIIAVPIALAVGVLLGLCALKALSPLLRAAPIAAGLRIGTERPPPDEPIGEWLLARDASLRARRLCLRHDGRCLPATLGDLGVGLDVHAIERQAERIGHQGSIWRRLREARRARAGQIDLPLLLTVRASAAAAYLARFAAQIERAPTDAAVDLDHHRRIADVPGLALDAEASAAAIAEALLRDPDRAEFELVTRELPAKVTLSDLGGVDVTKVLSVFETSFSPYETGRSQNVALAATKLDGLTIAPGQTASFNERVGPRTREAGFHEAPEIVGDELTVGIGGGTCQVSGTLHGAALWGGLEVVARRSHSRPSSYTRLGLDATVKYGEVDLQLRNPYRFAVLIHAFVPKPGLLRVELLGGDDVERVEYRYGVSNVEPFLRRITEKDFLAPGTSLLKQKGTRGMDVHSTVTIFYKSGHVETRQYFSGYRPAPEVYWVAPGYDVSKLPPLPHDAKGVETAADQVYGAG